MRRWKLPALEALVAFAVPALFLATSILIRVNPRDRLGQVSGLAALEFRFFVFAIVLVAALVIAARVREGRGFDVTSRLVCAAAAGLATGLIAGGILVALRGTPWGLHTQGGDVSALLDWVANLRRGEPIPPMYPPLSLHAIGTYADVSGLPPEHAIKHLQIAGTLAFGPVAYLCWRMLLKPAWALGIGVIAMLPLVDAYKVYPNLVLTAFVPLTLAWLRYVRDIEGRTWGALIKAAIAFGVTFGSMFLLYSGWFKWAAPGLLVAVLVVFPWRTARSPALAFVGSTGVAFLLVCGRFLFTVLFDPGAAIRDTFIYFDVHTEPMYIAMWRNDLQGRVGTWPPFGELGGVGLFTLVLAAGFGLAIAYGRNRVTVIGMSLMMVGAWLLRFWYARMMWETRLVQLYPRTTALILYCLIALTGLAVFWIVRGRSADSPLRSKYGIIGAVCALLFAFASTGSATADRYMPSKEEPPSLGLLSWTAHQVHRQSRTKFSRLRVLPWLRRESLPMPPTVSLP